MNRLLLPLLLLPVYLAACASSANAGLLLPNLVHKIHVPMLKAVYESTSGDFEIIGMASVQNLNGSTLLHDFNLDANFDANGVFNSKQKGSFSIKSKDGSVTLLRGTITEASGSLFASQGKLEFLATMYIEGQFASLYRDQVGVKVNLSASVSQLNEQGFAFAAGSAEMGPGTAEVGRPVPEPASGLIFATVFLSSGILAGRRGRRR